MRHAVGGEVQWASEAAVGYIVVVDHPVSDLARLTSFIMLKGLLEGQSKLYGLLVIFASQLLKSLEYCGHCFRIILDNNLDLCGIFHAVRQNWSDCTGLATESFCHEVVRLDIQIMDSCCLKWCN